MDFGLESAFGDLDVKNLPCWSAHFPPIVTRFSWSILYTFIYSEYLSTHQRPDTFLLIFLFKDGSLNLFWNHLGKKQRLLNILWSFPGAKTNTSKLISYWFTWCLYVVPSFVFSFSTDALTDVVLHCFFSIPSSLPPTLQFFYKSNCHFDFFSSSRIFLVWGTSLQRERVAVLA